MTSLGAKPAELPTSDRPRTSALLTWAALAVALIGLAGSLWLSLGLDLKPCPLCYYQRTFVMAVVGVLGMGVWAGRSSPLSLLALPAATGGLGVAVWHVHLEQAGKLECPRGIGDIGSAPQQSLAAFALLFLLLLADGIKSHSRGGVACAVVLGGLLAWGGIKTVPPPKLPQEHYKEPLDICRPPFHG